MQPSRLQPEQSFNKCGYHGGTNMLCWTYTHPHIKHIHTYTTTHMNRHTSTSYAHTMCTDMYNFNFGKCALANINSGHAFNHGTSTPQAQQQHQARNLQREGLLSTGKENHKPKCLIQMQFQNSYKQAVRTCMTWAMQRYANQSNTATPSSLKLSQGECGEHSYIAPPWQIIDAPNAMQSSTHPSCWITHSQSAGEACEKHSSKHSNSNMPHTYTGGIWITYPHSISTPNTQNKIQCNHQPSKPWEHTQQECKANITKTNDTHSNTKFQTTCKGGIWGTFLYRNSTPTIQSSSSITNPSKLLEHTSEECRENIKNHGPTQEHQQTQTCKGAMWDSC